MATFAKFTIIQNHVGAVIKRKRNCGGNRWLRILSDSIFYRDASTHLAKSWQKNWKSWITHFKEVVTVLDGCYVGGCYIDGCYIDGCYIDGCYIGGCYVVAVT